MAAFAIETSVRAQRCDLRVSGDVDLDVAHEVVAMGLLSLNSTQAQEVAIDLSAISFIDSTGLGALVIIRNAARKAGKTVTLCNVPARIQRLLTITGLDHAFGISEHAPTT